MENWKLLTEGVTEDNSIPWGIVTSGPYEIVVCRMELDSSQMSREDFDRNMKLISAAPDLLKVAKAVKRLEKIISFSNPKNESEFDEATALNSLIKLAEKSIEKAQ